VIGLGDPKKPSKKYSSPRNPWRADQLAQELYLLGVYGLRNKREFWRAQTQLSNLRKQARNLLATTTEMRIREEPKFLDSLKKRGIIGTGATLDDVLSLTVENLLERRLQTIVWRKGIAISPHQARQLITHRHVTIVDRIITIPSYNVSADEEGHVTIREGSTLKARQSLSPPPLAV
jgi:small subunit ribosomal protein S4